MGFLDDIIEGYAGTTGLLNQKAGDYYKAYQDWGAANREAMPEWLNRIGEAAGQVAETPGMEAIAPMGITLSELQGAPRGAFRRLISGPGNATYVDNFTPFSSYVKHYYKKSYPQETLQNAAEAILDSAGNIVTSNKQLKGLLNTSEDISRLLIGPDKTWSTDLVVGVRDLLKPGLAGVADKNNNYVALALGRKYPDVTNTLLHEMTHIWDRRFPEELEHISKMQDIIRDYIQRTHPRPSLLTPERLEYFSDPGEVLARGVAKNLNDRMGTTIINSPESWYRHYSWPEELDPLLKSVADRMLRY